MERMREAYIIKAVIISIVMAFFDFSNQIIIFVFYISWSAYHFFSKDYCFFSWRENIREKSKHFCIDFAETLLIISLIFCLSFIGSRFY